MRCDTPVYFLKITQGELDPSTGNHAEAVTTEALRWASVTDAGEDTIIRVYGEIRQGCKTVRLQNKYTEPFDRIRIGGKVYNVDFSRTLRVKQVFVVSEVQ